MTPETFLAALRATVDGRAAVSGTPALDVPAVLDVPEGLSVADVVAATTSWAGRPRNLASGGFTDPSLTEYTGLPLVEPFGTDLLEMRGWGRGAYWFGCGRIAGRLGTRTIAVVAPRRDPAVDGFPEGASWAEKLRLLTGFHGTRSVPRVDWAGVEAELGTELPADYKEIADLFGAGSFDWYVDLLVPGALGTDLLADARWDAVHADDLFRPYPAYPTPDGLLRWGASEQEIVLCWQTGAASPDDWPVLVQTDFGSWERYDCGVGEFLVRLLTDIALGFPTARLGRHCFVSEAP